MSLGAADVLATAGGDDQSDIRFGGAGQGDGSLCADMVDLGWAGPAMSMNPEPHLEVPAIPVEMSDLNLKPIRLARQPAREPDRPARPCFVDSPRAA